MATIRLQNDGPAADTLVSNKFLDRFMPQANGEFVKVYLYLLRCVQSNSCECTVSAIADKLGDTEADVLRALRYWQKTGVLALEETADGQPTGIRMLPLPETAAETEPKLPAVPPAPFPTVSTAAAGVTYYSAVKPEPAMRRYTPDEVAEFQKDPDILELLFVVETYVKHPLGENDINTVLFWHEQLGFSVELIIYLLEYCISKGHSSMRYLNKVALGWHEKGITSVDQAKADAAIHSQAYYGVMKALGITGRSLVAAETAYIRKWTKDYAFDLSLIEEACARTIAAIHQPSFEYVDSILTSWHDNNVHTADDVKRLDETRRSRREKPAAKQAPRKKNSFNNFVSRDYDYKNLEELLLSSSTH